MKKMVCAGLLYCTLILSQVGFAQNYSYQSSSYQPAEQLYNMHQSGEQTYGNYQHQGSYSSIHSTEQSNPQNVNYTYGNKQNQPSYSTHQGGEQSYGNNYQSQGTYSTFQSVDPSNPQNVGYGSSQSNQPSQPIFFDDPNTPPPFLSNSNPNNQMPSQYQSYSLELPFNSQVQETYGEYNMGGIPPTSYGSTQYTPENYHAFPAPIDQPVSKTDDGCWSLYCQYEPCYYDDWRCIEEQKHCQRQCCRYIPKYYEVQHCKYVPQFYTETYCRYEPEYYLADDVRPCRRWVCEKKCKMTPKYYYRHVCGDPCCTNPCPVN